MKRIARERLKHVDAATGRTVSTPSNEENREGAIETWASRRATSPRSQPAMKRIARERLKQIRRTSAERARWTSNEENREGAIETSWRRWPARRCPASNEENREGAI